MIGSWRVSKYRDKIPYQDRARGANEESVAVKNLDVCLEHETSKLTGKIPSRNPLQIMNVFRSRSFDAAEPFDVKHYLGDSIKENGSNLIYHSGYE
jgi:hypothetical protein